MLNTMVQSLSQTTAATFEELALVFPDAELSSVQKAASLDTMVSVEFRGPIAGRLVLRASDVILPTIAANMLGEAQGKRSSLQRDALGEVANVICGNLLPRVCGADSVFNLSAPRVHENGGQFTRVGDDPTARVQFGIDDGRAEVAVFLFDAAARASSPSVAAVG